MLKIRLVLCVIFLQCLAGVSLAWADSQHIYTIELQNQSADKIIETLKPLISKDTIVTSKKNILIIKSNQKEYWQIKKLVKKLDEAVESLLITVHVGSLEDAKILEDDGKNRRVYRTENKDEDNRFQRVRVMDGQIAFISSGKSIPIVTSAYASRDFSKSRRHKGKHSFSELDATIDYRKLETGFFVLPSLQGNTVTLKIAQQREQQAHLNPLEFIENSLQTETQVRLGEWYELGSSSARQRRSTRVKVYRAGNRQREQRTIYIKVNLAHP